MYKKIKFIQGKNIDFREVNLADAAFILSLRVDENLNQFISKVDNDLKAQEEWIRRYEEKTNENYFIIQCKDQIPWGTIRLYDFKEDSFCWGSWIIKRDAPMNVAMESVFLIYDSAFYHLGFQRSHFDVRKGNKRVVDFHLKLGAKIVAEDEANYYFHYELSDFLVTRQRYHKFLCEKIVIS